MSKDVLNDLKSNYTKDCSDDASIFYDVTITDAIRKKVQQITGKKISSKLDAFRQRMANK